MSLKQFLQTACGHFEIGDYCVKITSKATNKLREFSFNICVIILMKNISVTLDLFRADFDMKVLQASLIRLRLGEHSPIITSPSANNC